MFVIFIAGKGFIYYLHKICPQMFTDEDYEAIMKSELVKEHVDCNRTIKT